MHASSSLQYPVDLQYIIIIISVLAMAAAAAALRHVTIVLNGVRHAVYSVCVCQMMTCWRTRWRDITARCRWWLHHTQTTHVAVYLLTVQWCVCHAASWLINVNVQSSTQSLCVCVCVCVCVCLQRTAVDCSYWLTAGTDPAALSAANQRRASRHLCQYSTALATATHDAWLTYLCPLCTSISHAPHQSYTPPRRNTLVVFLITTNRILRIMMMINLLVFHYKILYTISQNEALQKPAIHLSVSQLQIFN